MRFPTALGGRNLPTPLTAVCETVWNHLESCCFELGGLRELLFMEYKEALHSWKCNDLEELQRAIALSNLQWRQASQNRFVYACFLAHMLRITLVWEPFPQDSFWCTSSVQLAHLLKDSRANLSLPGHIPSQRFLCTSIQEESDTGLVQDSSGASVEIFLNPGTAHSTSSTIRDVLLLNFPAARDTHQLRALLCGTPLCEIRGSTRSGLHREGILINFAALEVRQDMEEAVQTPSPLLFEPPDAWDQQ
jgi:hypothetical protein